ncbi:hypothetical protein [Nonomuraea recticatena]|uniref:Uncharacterized protein n=1 Tax=Nonomuraea recticatena TaxID=46178 RepID=A0ABP6FUE6_9ACTN
MIAGLFLPLRWLRLAVCATLVITFVAGRVTYTATAEQGERDALERVLVQAELIKQTRVLVVSRRAPVPVVRVFHAQWTAPDGTEHSGQVTVPSSAEIGTRHDVWVDRHSGALVAAPATHQDAIARASSAVVLSLLGCTLIIVVAGRVTQTWISRDPAHSIDVEWRLLAAEWRRRYL